MINEHIVKLDKRSEERISNMYQWDTGQKIVFERDDILAGSEVQFEDGSVKIITNKAVEIPDNILKTFGLKQCWVQVIGSNHETTSYCITFEVLRRNKKNDYVEPANEATFRQQINAMVSNAVSASSSASRSASSAIFYAGEATKAKNDAVTAKNEAVTAKNEAVAAKESAINAKDGAVTAKNIAVEAKNAAIEAKNSALEAVDGISVPTKVSQLVNDVGYLTQHQDISGKQDKLTAGENIVINGNVISAVSNDVPDWAMEPNKPTYTASEVGALPEDTVIPVVPTKVSAFENDSGYLTQHQDISGKQDKIDDLEEIRSKANSALQTHQDISGKVDKVTGKGLSQNDYTNSDKAKVSAIPENPKYTDTVYDDTDIKESLEYVIRYKDDEEDPEFDEYVLASQHDDDIEELEGKITKESNDRSAAIQSVSRDLVNLIGVTAKVNGSVSVGQTGNIYILDLNNLSADRVDFKAYSLNADTTGKNIFQVRYSRVGKSDAYTELIDKLSIRSAADAKITRVRIYASAGSLTRDISVDGCLIIDGDGKYDLWRDTIDSQIETLDGEVEELSGSFETLDGEVEELSGKTEALEADIRKVYIPSKIYSKYNTYQKIYHKSIVSSVDVRSVWFAKTNNGEYQYLTYSNRFMKDYIQAKVVGLDDMSVYCFDSKTGKGLCNKTIHFMSKSSYANPEQTKNVLIVGDSFIENQHIPNRFASVISENDLTNINFVGKRTTSEGVKHEGHGGYKFSDYLSESTESKSNPFWYNGAVNFSSYAASVGVSTIDYVYIHLGVNDLLANKSAQQIITDMETFIGHIKTSFPSVKIVVDGLIPCSDYNSEHYNAYYYNSKMFILNQAMEASCDGLNNVFFSNIAPVFNSDYGYPYEMVAPYDGSTETIKRLTDYLHPNVAGYYMIADQSAYCFMYNM